jgi:hypothetical protein
LFSRLLLERLRHSRHKPWLRSAAVTRDREDLVTLVQVVGSTLVQVGACIPVQVVGSIAAQAGDSTVVLEAACTQDQVVGSIRVLEVECIQGRAEEFTQGRPIQTTLTRTKVHGVHALPGP